MHSTFWALPLFSSAAVRYKREWGYVVQWLLWQTGQRLTTYLPHRYQQYVSNNVSSSAAVVNSLPQTHQCPPVFEDCINLLLRRLLSLQLVSSRFVKTVEDWLQDLKQVAYDFPLIGRQADPNCTIPVTWSPVLASSKSESKRCLLYTSPSPRD